MQFKYTASLLLNVLLPEEHIYQMFPPSCLHCSSLLRKVLIASLTTLSGVAVFFSPLLCSEAHK